MAVDIKDDLLKWLNQILAIHISDDLFIVHNKHQDYYIIKSVLNDSTIKIKMIDGLWSYGTGDLSCSFYQDLQAPGLTDDIHTLNKNDWFCYDVMGLSHWMLARAEEINRVDLDQHSRFSSKSSHAYKYRYLERPIVDEWMHLLKLRCVQEWPSLSLTNHVFKMIVSHDVDRPSRFARLPFIRFILATGRDVLIDLNLSYLIKAPLVYLCGRSKLLKGDPNNTFEWLMDQSDAAGIKSAFYFIMGKTDPRHDSFYHPDDKAIRKLMRRIHERGHEIGLHPSYNTYKQPALIKEEANKLKSICEEEGIIQEQWGGRMHYLRWQMPTTLHGWNDANMDYDSSLSYADHAGFRCGTCREYPAYDPIKKKVLGVKVRPLIAMECSVISAPYMGLGHTDNALNKFLQLKNECKKVNGNFTLLWHNSFFANKNDFKIYKGILNG